MSKSKAVSIGLPRLAVNALRQLGENIAIARIRRKEPQAAWAERIGISLPTYIRLERGDPAVSMAAYAGALWLMGRIQALPEIAAPDKDIGALELDVRAARGRGRVRAPASIAGRLNKVRTNQP